MQKLTSSEIRFFSILGLFMLKLLIVLATPIALNFKWQPQPASLSEMGASGTEMVYPSEVWLAACPYISEVAVLSTKAQVLKGENLRKK
jgi:hypothetical protein